EKNNAFDQQEARTGAKRVHSPALDVRRIGRHGRPPLNEGPLTKPTHSGPPRSHKILDLRRYPDIGGRLALSGRSDYRPPSPTRGPTGRGDPAVRGRLVRASQKGCGAIPSRDLFCAGVISN